MQSKLLNNYKQLSNLNKNIMSYIQTLISGEQKLFKAESLTQMQKITLRFVVVGLIYYGFAVIEGMIMRIYQVEAIEAIGTNQYFAILTAHPLVGIFGSTYSIVFGAFLFLVPYAAIQIRGISIFFSAIFSNPALGAILMSFWSSEPSLLVSKF